MIKIAIITALFAIIGCSGEKNKDAAAKPVAEPAIEAAAVPPAPEKPKPEPKERTEKELTDSISNYYKNYYKDYYKCDLSKEDRALANFVNIPGNGRANLGSEDLFSKKEAELSTLFTRYVPYKCDKESEKECLRKRKNSYIGAFNAAKMILF